ncbi:hypothetical protein Tco_0908451 [Tanacetum coccineum]|uniref:PiggyBac transposable element-derived protein domain-containing protein n=1 Tax=Tanacetum coccineum TaxID=301880 RepID=A0ABQ5CM83_9ASTR
MSDIRKPSQTIPCDAGSENRTPMLERGSIIPRLQDVEDLQGDDLLYYDAEMELMNIILLSIPNKIYNSVDSLRVTRNQAVIQGDRVNKSKSRNYGLMLEEIIDELYVPRNECSISVKREPKSSPDRSMVLLIVVLFNAMTDYFEQKSSNTTINSAAQPTHNQEDSPSTSSIIIDTHEAPPIVTTSDEQTSLIFLQESDEFNQEDSADFDGNTQFVPYDSLIIEEIESSTMNLRNINVA